MEQTKLVVGIDISKKTFDVALPVKDGYVSKQYTNDVKGFKQLVGMNGVSIINTLLRTVRNDAIDRASQI